MSARDSKAASGLSGQRQVKPKPCTLALPALSRDSASVSLDNLATNGQPHPGTLEFTSTMQAFEHVKYLVFISSVEPNAIVGDGHLTTTRQLTRTGCYLNSIWVNAISFRSGSRRS
ncbi:hypothetical protein DOQ08_02110 [Marinobacter litoralis]|uniref:Uncharacterized protein n=1 Tax=Marinobacter litoralis TaxID=187981 RepID=A0A3M2RBI2_9GAMM|nr:hypothetical protein DOQ08_02110 [Marinobacter litoralis]